MYPVPVTPSEGVEHEKGNIPIGDRTVEITLDDRLLKRRERHMSIVADCRRQVKRRHHAEDQPANPVYHGIIRIDWY
jgi:hypothetical protein